MGSTGSYQPDADKLVAVRHDLHAHPELAFCEHRTSDIVAHELAQLGFQVTSGIAGTGVIGTLSCGTGRRSLGLRADMDALPIEETTGLAYASRYPGKMHACGHDGHMVMLLGAAQTLSEKRSFDGTVHLIFQPAEEEIGGARVMIDDGLFDRFPCDAVFGMHNFPGFPAGQFLFKPGVFTACGDFARIEITGSGGHAAQPHETVDPVVVGSSIVMALQTIVARNIAPIHMAVITVGKFHAGTASNVVPHKAFLELSVRSFDDDVRDLLETRIKKLVKDQAISYGADATVDYQRGYPATVNSQDETDFARDVAVEYAGSELVQTLPEPFCASEDFSFMLKEKPGCFLGLGIGECGAQAKLHESKYDFNDGCLLDGAGFWSRLVERYLPN